LYQQLAPVNTWDKTFFVPVAEIEKDIVRIVASKSGTNINQRGGTIRTGVLGANSVHIPPPIPAISPHFL
jgi:hypothetical protein